MLLIIAQQSAASMTAQVFDQFLRRRTNQVYFGFFVGLALYSLITLATVNEPFNPIFGGTQDVLPDPGPWVYVSELTASSVNFTVYFWVESEQANVLKVSDKVATGIKYALDEAGIDMPYPHSVVLFHDATATSNGQNTWRLNRP